jgi:hypothetical protein
LSEGREGIDPELGPLGHARGVDALGEDATKAAVLGDALPGHDEVAVGVHGDGGFCLTARREAVDLELGSLGHARGVEAPGEDAVTIAVLAVALPRHDEVAVGIHGHGQMLLIARGEGIDLDLGSLGHARGVEALDEDAVTAAVLAETLPRHDEVAVGVRGDGRIQLRTRREAVGLDLGTLGRARSVEALGEDARAIGISGVVLAEAIPRHDEVAVGVHGHGRQPLIASGEGVDLELGPLGHTRGVEAPGEDALIAAVLAGTLPRHDEVAVGVHGHGRRLLNARGEVVDLELGPLGRTRSVEALGEDAVAAAVLV